MMNILTRLFGVHSSQNCLSISRSVQGEKWFWIKAMLHFVQDFYTVRFSSIYLFWGDFNQLCFTAGHGEFSL